MAEKVSGINMLFCSLNDILVITELLLDRGLWGLQTADGAAVSCRPAPVTREVSRHKSQLTLHSSPPCYWKYEAEREQRETSNQQDLFSCRLWPGLTLAGAARHHLLLPPAGTSRVSAQKLSPLTYRENRFVFLIKKNNTKRDHWGWIPLQLRTSRPHL